jgi:hypothetical protein
VDTNLLVYAHRKAAPNHGAARAALRSLIEGNAVWAVPWPCCHEFLSVMTNRRLWKDGAVTIEEAWVQLEAWAASPSGRLIGETDNYLALLGDLVRRPRVWGPLVHDARIAAICIAHGVDVLFTCDRDFSLFPELRTHNPLRS